MADIQKKPVGITETILRDAHQSLIATRMPTEIMLPIVPKMDEIGYHSVECWGGATFDASLRFLKEDPWDRLRKLRDGFKKTKLQMLLRGQNLLGYSHYSDDVVTYFVQKSLASSQLQRVARKLPSNETVRPRRFAVSSIRSVRSAQLSESAGVMPDMWSQSKFFSSDSRS